MRAGSGAAHVRFWGAGEPVIALHPFGLESSAFAGVGECLAEENLQTLAVDLPGFGETPLPAVPLTPANMAAPVIELARSLDSRPALIGLSMGGRVALEAAATAPDAFRSVIAIQPYLPWRRFRGPLQIARLMSPQRAEALPVEVLWPVLKWIADSFEGIPWLRDDAMAMAGKRILYNLSCPATRRAVVSAARELALDPLHGPSSIWLRMREITAPTTFIWGERDRLVPAAFGRQVSAFMPAAEQLVMPCIGHAINGPHHRCLARVVAAILVGRDRDPERLVACTYGKSRAAPDPLRRPTPGGVGA